MLLQHIFEKRNSFQPQKSPFRSGGCMPPDIKYNVGKFHIALHPARLAYNQPGVFCRISPLSKNFQKFFSKKAHLAGSERRRRCLGSGKGEDHLIPQRKGVRNWDRSPATMTSGFALTHSARRSCETKPGTICGICAASGGMRLRWMPFRRKKWTSSPRWTTTPATAMCFPRMGMTC